MARAMKASGGGAATKRRDRRQAKFNPGPGPDTVKPIGVADTPVTTDKEKKPKKALGKMSKKRKAEGGMGGGGDKVGKDEKKFKKSDKFDGKKDASSKKHASTDKHKPPATKKEQKEWSNEQKSLTKPNHGVITELVGYWENLRSKKTNGKKLSSDEKQSLVTSIFKASKGKVPELANNHKGSRVIQALLKFGTDGQKKSVYAECVPEIAQLAKSLYGHFLVKKVIDEMPKNEIPKLLAHVKGSVRALAKHPVGSQVLESLYFPAPPAERLSMRCEFYGSEFAYFGAGGADGDGKSTAPKNLREAMRLKPQQQRQGMLRQMNAALLPILEKGLVSPSLVHAALCEYLDVGGPGTKHEAAQSLAGPAYLRMIHTREGAWAVNLLFSHAGAKQRKAVLKALKGQVGRIARDEHAAVFLAFAVECTDDTKLVAKSIITELRDEGLAELASDKAARRILLHLLRPRSTRYLNPHVLATIPDPEETAKTARETREALAAGGHFKDEEEDDEEEGEEGVGDEGDDDDMDDEMMDDEFEEEEEEGEPVGNGMTKQRSRAAEAGGDDMDDDDDEGGGGDGMDFGVSRKDASQRRREIFGAPGHLGRSLVAACVNSASSMLRSKEASDVLFEVCSGGAGGVVCAAVGDAQMRELHDAVVEAARASVAGEEVFPDDDDEDEKTEKLALHEDYFATRCLRRMVLEIPGDNGDESSPPSFAASLWEGAIEHDAKKWIDGHGNKVIAAIVKAGDEETKGNCIAALKKLLPKGTDPEEWAAGFFRHQEGGDKKGKKATEKKMEKSAKTPAKKKSSKAADTATPAASKSPKDKKFSPRLTRAQREAKATGKVGKK